MQVLLGSRATTSSVWLLLVVVAALPVGARLFVHGYRITELTCPLTGDAAG